MIPYVLDRYLAPKYSITSHSFPLFFNIDEVVSTYLFKQRINKHREPHCRVISYHRIWYGTASQNSVQEAIETEERNRQPEAGAAPFRKRKNRARQAISRFSVPLLYKLDRRGGVHGVRMFKFTNHARWGIYLLSGGNAQPVRSRRNGFFRLPNGPRTPAWFHSYQPQAALGNGNRYRT